MIRVGDPIDTLYGPGKLVGFKETSNIYIVDLPFGKLYATKETIQKPQAGKKKSAMEINDAYEALDTMRRLNLEISCNELGIAVDYDSCVTCLMSEAVREEKTVTFPRMRKFIDTTKKLRPRKVCPPCLICGSPVCSNHNSTTFRQEKVNVCLNCENLFSSEYIVDCLIMGKNERQRRVDHILDLYDRTALLLKYSSQYIDEVVESLEQNKARQNKLGVGGSTAGIVSGALGVAAAATILTPAGPPLLIASLLFGGSATAVSTGTEVRNRYFSEPHQVAGNIIALHGMLKNILKVADLLRDVVARDTIVMEHLKDPSEDAAVKDKVAGVYQQNRSGVLAGLTTGRFGMAGMEMGQMAAAEGTGAARLFSRTSSNVLKTVRFVRFAGGAISAATLVIEAKCMNETIRAIKAGNPCDKANSLRRIKEEILHLPSTSCLDRECKNYIEAMNRRNRKMTEQEAIRLLVETAQAQAESEYPREEEASAKVKSILGSEDNNPSTGTAEQKADAGSTSLSGSLLYRIRKFKGQNGRITDQDPVSIDNDAPAGLLG